MDRARLVHHDLIAVPLGRSRPGIYWLRLYILDMAEHVAVITEVPGDPSQSATNAISRIATHVMREFRLDPTRTSLYQISPSGSSVLESAEVRRVTLSERAPRRSRRPGRSVGKSSDGELFSDGDSVPVPHWHESSRADIEKLLGIALEPLPGHDVLYARVVSLGGGNQEEVWQPVFEAVPVIELPAPHGLFKCSHYDRFQRIEASLSAGGPVSPGRPTEAGRRFWESLSVEDRLSCDRHKGDWEVIADESVRILHALGRREKGDYAAAAMKVRLRKVERNWLVSLFGDPIAISGGEYINGQHRACALRFSGAERAAVVVDSELMGEIATDWKYEGDG